MNNQYNPYSPRIIDHQPSMGMSPLEQLAIMLGQAGRFVVGNPDEGLIKVKRPQGLPNGTITSPNFMDLFID